MRFGLEFAGRTRKHAHDAFDDPRAILDFLGLADAAALPAGGLTPARQRLLEIGMALGARPRVLLLDEVAAGLTHAEVDATAQLIRRVRDELGLAVIWIEHAVRVLMNYVERVAVLHQGSEDRRRRPRAGGEGSRRWSRPISERRAGMSAALSVRRAVRRLRRHPGARPIDLEAPAARLTVVVGPNGAGKTTLLKALSGLIPRAARSLFDGAAAAAEPVGDRVARPRAGAPRAGSCSRR